MPHLNSSVWDGASHSSPEEEKSAEKERKLHLRAVTLKHLMCDSKCLPVVSITGKTTDGCLSCDQDTDMCATSVITRSLHDVSGKEAVIETMTSCFQAFFILQPFVSRFGYSFLPTGKGMPFVATTDCVLYWKMQAFE